MGCAQVHQCHLPVPRSTDIQAKGPLIRIMMDLQCLKPQPTYLGELYCLLIVDDYTRYSWCYLLRVKGEAVGWVRQWWMEVVKSNNRAVRYVRGDLGGEWDGMDMADLMIEVGATVEGTRTAAPKYNGVAERCLAILDQGGRAHLYSAGLGANLWLLGEAMLFSNYIMNRSSAKSNKEKLPHLRLLGIVGFLVRVPAFGTPGYSRVDANHKLGPPGKPCISWG
ncbi:unnamed protein product [Discosporangium mesarthrocarpum]